jgi:hypothetical protein
MDSVTLAGMTFNFGEGRWEAGRRFPFLPAESEGDELTIAIVHDEDAEAEGREVHDQPTEGQRRALQRFLDHEQTICEALLDALVRYIRVIREQDMGFFDDLPEIESRADLDEVVEFHELDVLPMEHDGEAVIGLGFSCEWDPEHGLGMALYKGHVVDVGQAEVSFGPDGYYVPREIFNEEQRAAWEAVFGELVHEHEAQMKEAADKLQQSREQTFHTVAEGTKHGPAVREFTRLLLDHPGRGMNFTLDVPPETAQPAVDSRMAAQFEKMMKNMGSLVDGPAGEAAAGMERMMKLAIEPPTPVLEVFLPLGEEWAMCHYSGQIRTERVDAGKWPQILESLANKWPGATLRPESVAILEDGREQNVEPDSPLRPAAIAAICEVFGVDPPTEEEMQRVASPFERLTSGPDGVKYWNALSDSQRKNAGPYKKSDLSNAVLDGANLAGMNFEGSCFDSASLVGVDMKSCRFSKSTFRGARMENCETSSARFDGCDFSDADLRGARFAVANLRNANFRGADLRGAKISMSSVHGADFSTAVLDRGVFVNFTEFDGKTRLPEDFRRPAADRLKWAGKGHPPE